jgi:ankyrin repeat protein
MIRFRDVIIQYLIPLPDLQHTLSYEEFLNLYHDARQRIEHPYFHHHELILLSECFQRNTTLRQMMIIYPLVDFWTLYEDSVLAMLSSYEHFVRKHITDLIHEEHKIAAAHLIDLARKNNNSPALVIEDFISYLDVAKIYLELDLDKSKMIDFINYVLDLDESVFPSSLLIGSLCFAQNCQDSQIEKSIVSALQKVMVRFDNLFELTTPYQEALGYLSYWNLLNTMTSYFIRYESKLYSSATLSTASYASLKLIKAFLEPNGHPTDLSYALYLQALSTNHEYLQQQAAYPQYTLSTDIKLIQASEKQFLLEASSPENLYNLFGIPSSKLSEPPSEPLLRFIRKRFYELITQPSHLSLTQIEFFNKLKIKQESSECEELLINLLHRHQVSIPLPLKLSSEKSIIKSAAQASGLLNSAVRIIWQHQKDFNLIEHCAEKKSLGLAPFMNSQTCSEKLAILKGELIVLGSRFRQEHPGAYYEDLALNATLTLQHVELYRRYRIINFNDETMCELIDFIKLEHQRKELINPLSTLGFYHSLKKVLTTSPKVHLQDSEFERLFIIAISYNHPNIIKLILNLNHQALKKLAPSSFTKEQQLEKISHGLYQSILLGHYSCMKVFLSYSDFCSKQELSSLFKLCVRYGHLEMIDLLLERVAGKDLSLYDSGLMHEAVKKHSLTALGYLLDKGCSLLKKNKQDQSIAHLALIFQQNDTLKFILDRAKINDEFKDLLQLTDSRGHNLRSLALDLNQSEWADYFLKINPEVSFFQVLSSHKEVRSILWSHYSFSCCSKKDKVEDSIPYPKDFLKKSQSI